MSKKKRFDVRSSRFDVEEKGDRHWAIGKRKTHAWHANSSPTPSLAKRRGLKTVIAIPPLFGKRGGWGVSCWMAANVKFKFK